jgi:hypothetical protein
MLVNQTQVLTTGLGLGGQTGQKTCYVRNPMDLPSFFYGTPTKRQVSKSQVSKCPVSKRLKCQVYKTSGLQNVRFTKCQVYKTSGRQNVRLQKNIHIYSVLVVGGIPQVLWRPCLQVKRWLWFILYFRGFFVIYYHNR